MLMPIKRRMVEDKVLASVVLLLTNYLFNLVAMEKEKSKYLKTLRSNMKILGKVWIREGRLKR